MVNAARTQRIYDHRLRNLVFSTGRIEIALDRGVPRSTARGWLRTSPREVVSIDELEHSLEELRNEVFALREKNGASVINCGIASCGSRITNTPVLLGQSNLCNFHGMSLLLQLLAQFLRCLAPMSLS